MSDQPDAVLASLASHPGWEILRDRAVKSRDQYMGNLAKAFYDNPASVSLESVEYKRGFFRGIFWLLNKPVFEGKELERLFQERERAAQAQEEPHE